MAPSVLYDDGRIACGADSIRIRRYYLWGHKTIPYREIQSVTTRPLTRWRGKWRLWGSIDLVHHYNLDLGRPHKHTAIEIDTGRHVRPVITPDDPEAVARIIGDHLAP